jgi:Icc protein
MTALRLLQITDPHLVGDPEANQRGVQPLQSFRAVLRAAAPASADVLLLTGDVVHDDPDGYRWARSELAPLDKPVLCIPGNHDDPGLLRTALAGEPFRHGGHHDFGDWRLVMLDSHLPGSAGGRLTDSELQRLQGALAGAAERHVLVVLHHQPVPTRSRWLDTVGLFDPEPFLDLIDAHANVRGILWGHVHQEFDGLRRNRHGEVRLMSTPSSNVQFKPLSVEFELDDRPPGFRRLELHADGRIDSRVEWLA